MNETELAIKLEKKKAQLKTLNAMPYYLPYKTKIEWYRIHSSIENEIATIEDELDMVKRRDDIIGLFDDY